jgi:hypothetical protein
VHIADDALEESFFTAGDNLASTMSTQFELPVAGEEDRRRGLKALIVTGAILVVAAVLLALLLPAPPSHPARPPTRGQPL